MTDITDAPPAPTDPISITREEFEDALDRLREAGVPLVDDRDQAWADFAGWRVNYDRVKNALFDWQRDPEPEAKSTRTVDIPAPDAMIGPPDESGDVKGY